MWATQYCDEIWIIRGALYRITIAGKLAASACPANCISSGRTRSLVCVRNLWPQRYAEVDAENGKLIHIPIFRNIDRVQFYRSEIVGKSRNKRDE